MIVVISDDKKEKVGKSIYNHLQESNIEAEYISASGRDIKPCYGCNGCSSKASYGKCVFRDDMDDILPFLLEGEYVIYTSPVTWGGVSCNIKKILDKTALIGDRSYNIRNKELVKGTLSNNKKIIGIGVANDISAQEKSDFQYLFKEIGTIMDIDHLTKIVDTSIETFTTEAEIEKLLQEVLA